MTRTKTALELVPGDKIVGEGTFPRGLYAGVVATVVVVDEGVQVGLEDGGVYVRPEDHRFVVEVDVESHPAFADLSPDARAMIAKTAPTDDDEMHVVCGECGTRWTIPFTKGRTTPKTPTSCQKEGCEAGWLDLKSFWLKPDADRYAEARESERS